MMASFSEAEKLLLFFDMVPKFTDLIVFTILSSHLGGQYKRNLKITLDLPQFFEFYKVINAKALSERIGMNQSLLAQYIKGIKKPSANQTNRILKGVQQVGHELSSIRFLP